MLLGRAGPGHPAKHHEAARRPRGPACSPHPCLSPPSPPIPPLCHSLLMDPTCRKEVSEKIFEPRDSREMERERGFLNIELRLSPVLLNSHKKAASEPTALVSYEYFIARLQLCANSSTAQKHLFGWWAPFRASGECHQACTGYQVTAACGHSRLTPNQAKFAKAGRSFLTTQPALPRRQQVRAPKELRRRKKRGAEAIKSWDVATALLAALCPVLVAVGLGASVPIKICSTVHQCYRGFWCRSIACLHHTDEKGASGAARRGFLFPQHCFCLSLA